MAYTDEEIDARIRAGIAAADAATDAIIDAKIQASKITPPSGAELAAAAAVKGTYPWGVALHTKAGYLGNFFAAGQVRAGSVTSSWANVDVDQGIAATAVCGLDIDAALALAKTLDGDIDGKSNTGTSTVKEGEERFIFGASYSGQQGVSISETSGVSANYVKGKRISWLAGDQWSLHKEGSAFSESYVDQMSSTTKAKGAVTSLTHAESVKSISISRLENFSFRQSEANVSSINVGSSTAEIIVAALSSNAYLNAVKATANVAIGSISTSFFGQVVDLKYIKVGKYEKTVTPFIVKAEDTTVSVTSGTGLEIDLINSKIASVVTSLEKLQTHLQMKTLQISKLETAFLSAGALIEGAGSAVGNWDISLNEAGLVGEINKMTISRTETELKNIKTSISSGNSSIEAKDLRINI